VFIELARTRGRNGGAMKLAPIAAAPETWPPLARMLKYQKSAGFLRVARYPYGGLGCTAALNTAFEKPKYSLYCHFLNLAVDSNGLLAH